MNKPSLRFPNHFLWGASTSSHQVEGHTVNNWSEWEKSPPRLEALAQSGDFKRYGRDNFISGAACEHLSRYREDYALAKQLGHTATRLSIEWSRVEPREGVFDETALAAYRSMIKHITSLGIAPLVTLYHWTVPLWFRDKGGWLNDGAVRAFTRFATKMAECLGGYVTHWITLNEPEIYAANSYLTGVWPPQQRNLIHFLRVFHRLIYAHRAAYHAIKRLQPTALIGIAKNNIYFEAAGHNPVNHILKALCDYGWNRYFLNRIKHHQDFIGLNYYFHNRMDWGRVKNKNERTSDLGWELYPQGIYDVLTELKAYHLPIYITENGLADAADLERGWFITETLRQVHRAIEQGVDVRGYLHWSLLDNFEWDKGFYPRFGLIAVDYATQKRTPRPSALLFASIAKNNRLEFDHL